MPRCACFGMNNLTTSKPEKKWNKKKLLVYRIPIIIVMIETDVAEDAYTDLIMTSPVRWYAADAVCIRFCVQLCIGLKYVNVSWRVKSCPRSFSNNQFKRCIKSDVFRQEMFRQTTTKSKQRLSRQLHALYLFNMSRGNVPRYALRAVTWDTCVW